MKPATDAQLRTMLGLVAADRADQGYDVDGIADAIASATGTDALVQVGLELDGRPFRDDWPHHEPVDLEGIRAASAPTRAVAVAVDPAGIATRIETAFLSRVAGCVLGKPFELDLTLDTIRAALQPEGQWPLRRYATLDVLDRLPVRHPQWPETAGDHLRWVAPDDDINYTILGMLLLERFGLGFTVNEVRDLWLQQLPFAAVFGPERTMLVRAGLETLDGGDPSAPETWARSWNPRDEWCGALIRADAYGYACPGDPETASALAWRDASFTHRRTGVYGAMFVAAALALAPVRDDALTLCSDALAFVPATSRFALAVVDALGEVESATDWIDGYRRIHERWPEHRHCRIFQEVGTLVNTLHFAGDAGEAIGMQVMQGNDTDSYGATAGSIAGMFFGPGSLAEHWIAPFGDDLRTALALFHERSLHAVATRMGALPVRARDPQRPELPY